MDENLKNNLKSESQWIRAIFMVLFFVIFQLTVSLVALVAVAQFIFAIFTGNDNSNLARFGRSMTSFIYQILQFLTYNNNAKPFPFADWPDAEAEPALKDDK